MSQELFQGQPRRSAGSGLTIPETFRAVPDPIDRRDRFIISPGETLNLRHRQLCRTKIRQGYIERIFLNTPVNYNFDAADLEKYDENTVPRGHHRVEYDWPYIQVRDLMQYQDNGVVDLLMLVGLPITDIEDIESAVLPPVEVLLWQLKEWLEDSQYCYAQIKASGLDGNLKDIAFEMRDAILVGVKTAWAFQSQAISEFETEYAKGMKPNGRGQTEMSPRLEHFYANLNRAPIAAPRYEREGGEEDRGGIKKFIQSMFSGKQTEELATTKSQLDQALAAMEEQKQQIAALLAAQAVNSKPAATEAKKPTPPANRAPQPPPTPTTETK